MAIQILCGSLWQSAVAEFTILPMFIPNEYLFKTHKDKGEERWEIYAWAIRDIIAKQGGLELIDISIRGTWNYGRILNGLKPFDDDILQPSKKKAD